MSIFESGAAGRLALGGARAAARGAENLRNREQVQADNAEHRLRRNVAEAQNTPENVNAQVEALQAQNQQIAAKQAKGASYEAFRMYTGDWNPRHLNTLLKNEPGVRQALGGMTYIDQLNPEIDAGLLTQAGITPETFNPKRHLKAVMPDGSTELIDMNAVFMGTGFFNHMQNEELDRLIKIDKLFGEPDSDFAPGGLEKDARFISETTGQGLESVTQSLFNKKTAGLTPGQQEMADQAIANMEEKTKETGGFFETDFTDRKNRVLVEADVRRFEALSGQQLSPKDRADLKDLNTLVKMAGTVGEHLTEEVTGFYDTYLRDVRKYIDDNVEDVDAQAAASAYGAFRNTMRHALFGSALTASEIQSFNEAFGTLKQSYPAVLTQFKTAVQQTKSKLETISRLNNPYLAHYYMGTSAEDIDVIISRLDERLNMISQLQGKGTPDSVDVPPADVRNLDDKFNNIFGPGIEQ